ncbi:MAG: SAM-dependent methyltransferase, partial [Planctomycetota bacterium]
MSLLSLSLDAVERGLIPDVLTRAAIRRLCEQRLRDCDRGNDVANSRALEGFVESMRSGPIAPVPEKANEQHYELPPAFFAAVLGPHCKYSSCFWPKAETSLAEAEAASLEITCERADLADGQDVLELGCGWGSLSLWMAERFHNSRITAVSNSAPQRRFIETEA